MAQTPSQQIQVLPQQLQSPQLMAHPQHLYMPQQHFIFPSNVTLQQGGGGGTLQSLGPSQAVSVHIQPKPAIDPKVSGGQNTQPVQNAVILQSKSPFPTMQNHVISGHMKQIMPRPPMVSQAPGAMYNHPQFVGSYALSPLPPGFQWAPANCYPQNPVIISRDHPNIYIQPQPQPQSTIQLPVSSGQVITPTSSSQSYVSQGVQTIATQTSAPSCLNSASYQGNELHNHLQDVLKVKKAKEASQKSVSKKALKVYGKTKNSGNELLLNHLQDILKLKKVKEASQKSNSKMVSNAYGETKDSEQSVGNTSELYNSVLIQPSEKLIQPNHLISTVPAEQQTAEKTNGVISTQTDAVCVGTESADTLREIKTEVNEDISSPPILQPEVAVPSRIPVPGLLNVNYSSMSSVGVFTSTASVGVCSSMSEVHASMDVCTSTTSDSSTLPGDHLESEVTKELSTNFIPQYDDTCYYDADSEQPVPEHTKPMADVKPVPEKEDSGVEDNPVPDTPTSSAEIKPDVRQSSEQRTERFNRVLKLKRLKPQDPIQTPYSRAKKDKQPQKAIVKPQMLKHVIDSYVIEEVTLKSLSDSSSTEVSDGSNSEIKNEVPARPVPNPVRENPYVLLEDCIPEKQEPLPVFKVGRGRGRPRGRGRGRPPKRKRGAPTRKSSRHHVEIIEVDPNESVSQMEVNSTLFDDENSDFCQTNDENFQPHEAHDSDTSFDISAISAVASEIGKTVSDVPQKSLNTWSVQEVFEFVKDFPGCLDFAECFKSQEIDGQALPLITMDHLINGMNMKLGPALKLISHINSIKNQDLPS